MAFTATSYLAPQFQPYKFYWIKFYVPGTTTAKAISIDTTGNTLLSKAQINNKGFIETAGAAIFIPHIEDFYDAYLFPNEADADANDTSSAIRIADNIINNNNTSGGTGVTVPPENQTLIDAQTTVIFTTIDTSSAEYHITGANVDDGLLLAGIDYTVTNITTIELSSSYPAGTIVTGSKALEAGSNLAANFLPYEFDTTVAMTGSPIVFSINKTLKRKGDTAVGDNDAASYIVKTLAQSVTDGDVIDGVRNYNLLDGKVAINQDGDRLFNPSATVITVGAGQDFSTINEAITHLARRRAMYVEGQSTSPATIQLATGFVMGEQVLCRGIDLSWITISSVDAEVVITRGALTVDIDPTGTTSYCAFGAVNGRTPVINTLFNMDATGVATRRDGLFCSNGSFGTILSGKGFKNCGEVGAYANKTSSITAEGAICSGAGVYGFFAFKGSTLNVQSAVADDCVQYGLYVNRASRASANLAQFNNCLNNAVRVIRGSTLSWEDGVGTGSTREGLYCLNSIAQCLRANVSNSGLAGIYSHDASSVDFRDGVAVACAGIASLWAFRCSTIDADNATVTGSLSDTAAVLAQRGSTINAQDADASGSTALYGIRSSEASTINAHDANAQKGGAPATSDCSVFFGGIIEFNGGTGGTSVTVNTITSDGIIFQ